MAPTVSFLDEWFAIVRQWQRQGRTNLGRGKHLRRYFREAGRVRAEVSASYEVYATAQALRSTAESITHANSMTERLLTKGLIGDEQAAQMMAALHGWVTNPDAFLATARGEGVGWNDFPVGT